MLRGAERGGAFRWQRQGEVRASQQRAPPESNRDQCAARPPPRSPWELSRRCPQACSPRGGWGPEPAMAPEAGAACAGAARPPAAAPAASSWTGPAWPGRPTAGAGNWAQEARGQWLPPVAAAAASATAPAAAPRERSRCEGHPLTLTPSLRRPGPTCLRRNSSSSSCRRFCSSCCCCCWRRFSSRRLRSSSSRFALSSTSLRSWNWRVEIRRQAVPAVAWPLTPKNASPRPTHFVLQLELF